MTSSRPALRAAPARALALSLTLALAACASTPPEAPGVAASVDDAEKMHCTREVPIGSQMPVTRCRTLAQIERERADAAKDVNTVRQSGTPGVSDRMGR